MKFHLMKFTLIELLVVLAIISILMALLFPSLMKAKAQAQVVVCGSNLKQVHHATLMYEADHHGWFVPNYGDAIGGFWHRFIGSRSEPDYLGFDPWAKDYDELEILVCPTRTTGFSYVDDGWRWTAFGLSALSGHKGGGFINWNRVSFIKQPSDKFRLFDIESGYTVHQLSPETQTYRHDNRMNMMYVDGHLELELTSTIPFTDPRYQMDN